MRATAADVDKRGERVELDRGESRKARRAKSAHEVVQGTIDDAGDDAIRLILFSTPHQVTTELLRWTRFHGRSRRNAPLKHPNRGALTPF